MAAPVGASCPILATLDQIRALLNDSSATIMRIPTQSGQGVVRSARLRAAPARALRFPAPEGSRLARMMGEPPARGRAGAPALHPENQQRGRRFIEFRHATRAGVGNLLCLSHRLP